MNSRFITTLVLALVARNVQSILDFITGLDKRLDAYIASQDAETARIDAEIEYLTDKRLASKAVRGLAANLQDGLRNLNN